jgi:hypothetical protein
VSAVRAQVRSVGARWELSADVLDRLVQLAHEMVGPGTLAGRLHLIRDRRHVTLTAEYALPEWEQFRRWRAQHPLGEDTWRGLMRQLADDWRQERSGKQVRLWARVTCLRPEAVDD